MLFHFDSISFESKHTQKEIVDDGEQSRKFFLYIRNKHNANGRMQNRGKKHKNDA